MPNNLKISHFTILSLLFHLIAFAAVFMLNDSDDKKSYDIEPFAVISSSDFSKINSNSSSKLIAENKIFEQKSSKSENSNQRIIDLSSGEDLGMESLQQAQNSQSSQSSGASKSSYVNLLAGRLEENKSYVSMASAPAYAKTKVVLKIKLDNNGNLDSFKVIESSGYQFFNKAAVKIVEISNPFPKPPADLYGSLEFMVPIFFET